MIQFLKLSVIVLGVLFLLTGCHYLSPNEEKFLRVFAFACFIIAAIAAINAIIKKYRIKYLVSKLEHQGYSALRAAKALIKIGGEQVIASLCQALQNTDKDVREAAAEVLVKIGGEQVIASLCQALQNTDWRVRRAAVKALIKIGGEQAIAPYV